MSKKNWKLKKIASLFNKIKSCLMKMIDENVQLKLSLDNPDNFFSIPISRFSSNRLFFRFLSTKSSVAIRKSQPEVVTFVEVQTKFTGCLLVDSRVRLSRNARPKTGNGEIEGKSTETRRTSEREFLFFMETT